MLATNPNLIDPASTPEELTIAAESSRRLHDLLDLLPDRQRSVLELRLAGLTGSEISRALGMSQSAIKSIQFRAYVTLRTALRDDQSEPRESSR